MWELGGKISWKQNGNKEEHISSRTQTATVRRCYGFKVKNLKEIIWKQSDQNKKEKNNKE